MPLDPAIVGNVDAVLRLIDREVWIVTAAAGDRRGGLLASWVSQTSLDPERPGIAAGIARNHFTAELIDAVGMFGLHLIGRDQLELAWRFALESGRQHDKLAGLAFSQTDGGPPILTGCIAWLDCRVATCFDTSDRRYYWAEIVAGGMHRPGITPLRESDLIAAASNQQLAMLKAGRAADIAVQRPLAERWRNSLSKPNP